MSELKIYCDGGSRGNPGPGAAAFVVLDADRIITKVGRFLGHTTNNQAEYQAVLFALEFVHSKNMHPSKIDFLLDSELIVRQMKGEYRIKNLGLQKFAVAIKNLERIIGVPVSYHHIPRNKNKLADSLVNRVLDTRKNIGLIG